MARPGCTYRGARRNDVNAWMYRQEMPRKLRKRKGHYMQSVADAALRHARVSGSAARSIPELQWVFNFK